MTEPRVNELMGTTEETFWAVIYFLGSSRLKNSDSRIFLRDDSSVELKEFMDWLSLKMTISSIFLNEAKFLKSSIFLILLKELAEECELGTDTTIQIFEIFFRNERNLTMQKQSVQSQKRAMRIVRFFYYSLRKQD